MKKMLVFTLLTALLLTGCSSFSKQNTTSTYKGGKTLTKNKGKDILKEDIKETSKESSTDNFQFTEYKVEDESYVEYLVAIKNNSDLTFGIEADAKAYDADNKLLDSSLSEIYVLGPNEESVLHFRFYVDSPVDHIDYKDNIKYLKESEIHYKPVISNFSVKEKLNGNDLKLSVTNKGNYIAEAVQVYAVFMDANDTPLKISSIYMGDSSFDIAPGAKQSGEINYNESSKKGEYDHVIYYLRGRASKSRNK